MPYIVIATNRPCVFFLQRSSCGYFPRAGVLRSTSWRHDCVVFFTYDLAYSAIQRSRLFAAQHPEHWYAREMADFQLKIVRTTTYYGERHHGKTH